MNQEFTDKLIKTYPLLYNNFYYFETEDGWNNLIELASSLIETELKKLSEEERENIHALQIKEKFGGLRMYLGNDTPFIRGVISMTELTSMSTCEYCGNKGKCSGKGWIKTLCDSCSI